MERLTGDELRRRRARAQLLHPARRTPAQIVRTLLVVQSQDVRQARIALWTRSSSLTQAAIDRAFERGEIVITWLNRGTLHMVAAEDYPWMLALTAPTQTTSNVTRLRRLGVGDPEPHARAIETALADGPLHRRDLRARLDDVDGQIFVHCLMYAALRGRIVRCHDHTWVRTADWLGALPHVDRDEALRELGRRYLKAHAPAEPEDLASWAGLPLRDARAALDGATAPRGSPDRVPPRLLPAWDEYLLGWKDRSFLVGGAPVDELYRGGLIGPAATVDGLAVGKWRAKRGQAAEVTLFADCDATFAEQAATLAAFEAL